jgi:NADPH2:quinone reductase
MRAVQVSQYGGPEVLEPAELPTPEPSDGEVLVEVTAAGINYADTHKAENAYLEPTTLPYVPGIEVVGRLPDGRRVVALVPGGGYAEYAVAAEGALFEVPEDVGDGAAAALAIQGMTAYHLLRTCARMQEGETVVVHSAAGGVGSLAVQLAKLWGAGRVIASASSEEKRALALGLGADAAIDSSDPDLRDAILAANGGSRVDIVLEMLGGEAFTQSFKSLRRFGRLVTYGQASRVPPPPLDPLKLWAGSKSVIGFWLTDCFARPQMIGEAFHELLRLTADGKLEPIVGGSYPLADARRAHEDLRARRTTGKLILTPNGGTAR